jgi:hypothetical protein
MLSQLLVTGIGFRLIAVGALDPRFQIVGANDFGQAAEKGEGAHMSSQPVAEFLAGLDFGIGVTAGGQRGHKNLRCSDFPGFRVGDRHCHPGIIQFQLFSAFVRQSHGIRVGLVPRLIVHPKLREPIPIRMLLPIFLPEQRQRYTPLRQLAVQVFPIWHDPHFWDGFFLFRK